METETLKTSIKSGPDKAAIIILLLFTVGSHLCLEKYRTRTVLIAAITLYTPLASFGQRYFLDGNTWMHIFTEGVLYVALGTVWFVPVLYALLFRLECLAAFPRGTGSNPVR